MRQDKVVCWEYEWGNEKIYITYPEDNTGYDLISCLKCGQLYAVNITKQVYIGPPLEEKLNELQCTKCASKLAETYSRYPDKYLSKSGQINCFERPINIPPDNQSIIKEFYSIY